MWAITSYFPFDDPSGVKRRLRVYREFRRHLQIPLVTIELSREGDFDLSPSDAEVLIRARGFALLWQKERLLNRALEALPSDCDTVAWMDCDVVFGRQDWAAKARELLKGVQIVQPFRRLNHLATDTPPALGVKPSLLKCTDSIAYRYRRGDLPDEVFRTHGASKRLGYSAGITWVASRELLGRHGLYDAAIVGGGDKLIFAAACRRQDEIADTFRMSPGQREHFETWAEPWSRQIRGRVGYLEGEAYHLWHGDLQYRNYLSRHQGFEAFDFDPRADLASNADGAWEWSSAKPELHRFVRSLFERRQGGPATAGGA